MRFRRKNFPKRSTCHSRSCIIQAVCWSDYKLQCNRTLPLLLLYHQDTGFLLLWSKTCLNTNILRQIAHFLLWIPIIPNSTNRLGPTSSFKFKESFRVFEFSRQKNNVKSPLFVCSIQFQLLHSSLLSKACNDFLQPVTFATLACCDNSALRWFTSWMRIPQTNFSALKHPPRFRPGVHTGLRANSHFAGNLFVLFVWLAKSNSEIGTLFIEIV